MSWWGVSSRFPGLSFWLCLAQEYLSDMSQGPPVCAHTSLSQGGFHQRGLSSASVSITPLGLRGALLCLCSWGGFLTVRMRSMWAIIFCLGRLLSQPGPAIAVSQFQSTGNQLLYSPSHTGARGLSASCSGLAWALQKVEQLPCPLPAVLGKLLPQVVTTKTISRHCEMALGNKVPPRLRTTWIKC